MTKIEHRELQGERNTLGDPGTVIRDGTKKSRAKSGLDIQNGLLDPGWENDFPLYKMV